MRRMMVAEVGERRRGPDKRDSRRQRGTCTGARPERSARSSRVKRRRDPGARWQSRAPGEGRSRTLERALRGEGTRPMEGTSDRLSGAQRSRVRAGADLGDSRKGLERASVPRASGSRDRGVRGPVHEHRDGKTTPAAVKSPKGTPCDPPKRIGAAVKQPISPDEQRASAGRAGEPARHGYSYEEVRWQKSVRRIACRCPRGVARRIGGTALAEERSASCADAHRGGSEARTVRVLRSTSEHEACAGRRSGQPGRLATRWKASRSSS